MSVAGRYRFQLASHGPAELAATADLLRLVFPRARHLTADYLDWLYRGNPEGPAIACNAWAGDELVGHMASQPMRAAIAGAEARGSYFLNGAIHPDHRRRRLQSRISAAMFEEAVGQGHDFATGTGNRYSTGPLLTRFRFVAPLEARLGFGLPRLRREPPPASFDPLWSGEGLRWRAARPGAQYAVAGSGPATALLAASGLPGIAALLMQEPRLADLQLAADAAPGPLRLWLGLDPAVDWNRSAYLPIPARLRPSPLNLVFKDLTGGDLLPDPRCFRFRAIDFDAY